MAQPRRRHYIGRGGRRWGFRWCAGVAASAAVSVETEDAEKTTGSTGDDLSRPSGMLFATVSPFSSPALLSSPALRESGVLTAATPGRAGLGRRRTAHGDGCGWRVRRSGYPVPRQPGRAGGGRRRRVGPGWRPLESVTATVADASVAPCAPACRWATGSGQPPGPPAPPPTTQACALARRAPHSRAKLARGGRGRLPARCEVSARRRGGRGCRR